MVLNVVGVAVEFEHATPVIVIPLYSVPIVVFRVPLVASVSFVHRYPDCAMQPLLPVEELPLKTPKAKRATSPIAITNIDQPYVIRYSMADCAFDEPFKKRLICPTSDLKLTCVFLKIF